MSWVGNAARRNASHRAEVVQCMAIPGYMPLQEFVASRSGGRVGHPNIEGVSTHALERARERLGVVLPRATWAAIYEGICEDRWAWSHGAPSTHGGQTRVYDVPVEIAGQPFTLPTVVGYQLAKPLILTVLDLIDG